MKESITVMSITSALQSALSRLFDRSWPDAAAAPRDEAASGEFISAYISEHDLPLPRAREGSARRPSTGRGS